jgi:hypothetical protein
VYAHLMPVATKRVDVDVLVLLLVDMPLHIKPVHRSTFLSLLANEAYHMLGDVLLGERRRLVSLSARLQGRNGSVPLVIPPHNDDMASRDAEPFRQRLEATVGSTTLVVLEYVVLEVC